MSETSSTNGQSLIGAEGGKTSEAAIIKDTDTANFLADVVEPSRKALVLVDFWAPWCGPCRQLTPVLEKLVRAAGGAVRLVKMNIDEHPQIPVQMGVQSIPAVFAFKDGRPVDMFHGALPESQVKSFLERLLGPGALSGVEDVLASANALMEEGDLEGASEIFAAVIGEDRENVEALTGLARCHIAKGRLEEAEKLLALVPQAKQSAAPVSRVRAMLELAKKGGGAGDVAALEARLAENADDHEARFELAMALNAQGSREAALEQLLELHKRAPEWNEQAARKQLLQLFEVWGPDDPLTIEGRRRLSLLLFS